MSVRSRKLNKYRRVSSSSDDDSGPSVRQLSTASKKKRVSALVETDSDTDHNEGNGIQTEMRSSERLNRRNSRSFQMPSRDSVWDSIPSIPTSTDKAIYRLKPRRVVKSFTRITHRYNQDVCYSEEDETGTDDFIVSDGEVSESEEEDCNGNRKTRRQKIQKTRGRHHRVKGYHPKILDTANMSSESDKEGEATEQGINSDKHGHTYSGVDNYQQCVKTFSGEDSEGNDQENCNWERRSKPGLAKRRLSQIMSSSDSDHSDGVTTNEVSNEVQHCKNSEMENVNNNVEPKCHNSMEMTDENLNKPGIVETSSKSPVSACGEGTCKTENGSGSESDADSSAESSSGSVSGSTSKSESPYSDSDHDAQCDLENIKSTRARHQIQKQASAKKKKFEAFLEARRKVLASKRN